jgi:multicomponent Na+:H+ antiporter subunit G
MRIIVDILVVVSIFFAFAGVVGMLRMPDSFTRMQSSTNIATMGVLGVIIGGIIFAAFELHESEMVMKLLVLGVFYIVTNPIAGHAICRGAYRHGVRPKKEMKCDKYGEDMVEDK